MKQAHSGSGRLEIGMLIMGSLVCSHRPLLHLFHTAHFARALRCAHSFARSLTHSLLSSWYSGIFVSKFQSALNHCALGKEQGKKGTLGKEQTTTKRSQKEILLLCEIKSQGRKQRRNGLGKEEKEKKGREEKKSEKREKKRKERKKFGKVLLVAEGKFGGQSRGEASVLWEVV